MRSRRQNPIFSPARTVCDCTLPPPLAVPYSTSPLTPPMRPEPRARSLTGVSGEFEYGTSGGAIGKVQSQTVRAALKVAF